MPRAPITPTAQAEVLVESQRRCCICFGLNRDTSLKVGQIAHLDGNAADSKKDKLAFLCFEHHDRLDSKTSQSKNLTVEEVKVYRTELRAALNLAFAREVVFGEARSHADPIAGHYLREAGSDCANLLITGLADGGFHVEGLALWGTNREYGPNTRELDFIAQLENNTLVFEEMKCNGQAYRAILTFADGALVVVEEGALGRFGLNVCFEGSYARAA